MDSSLSSTSSVTKATAASTLLRTTHTQRIPSHSLVSFRFSPKPKLRIFTKGLKRSRNHPCVVQAQINEVPTDGSSSSEKPPSTKPADIPYPALATEEEISEFIHQVSSLVKLVDSRDITELQLKKLDCEVIIRKQDAIPQPPSPSQPTIMYSPFPVGAPPVPPPPVPTSSPAPSPSASPPAAKSAAKSSHPPLKCPMAGTFYRSPGPGEPPFVKVGDKVQKGQVICIIEAMKLMNEIEADQSGTIVEIVAEDGKPVSVDTPLFIIQP